MYKKNESTLEIQQEEADVSESYTQLDAIRSGTKKGHQIHRAVSKLSSQTITEMCTSMGFALNNAQAQHITDYLYLIQKWNQSMNLVGKKLWQDVLAELIMDSLHLAKFLEENPRTTNDSLPSINTNPQKKKYVFDNSSNLALQDDSLQIWDLGAGAGLPGIPLRIFWQTGKYHMVEVREKRCFFLNTVLVSLGLPNTYVFRGKAEDFMSANLEKEIYADLIVSRAFMPWEKMLPFVAPYLRKKTNDPNSRKGSIIFLTLEKLYVEKYNTGELSWETKHIYPYVIKGQTKFLCEVCLKD